MGTSEASAEAGARERGGPTRVSSGTGAGGAGRVVVVTGSGSFLGTELIKRLEEDERYSRVLALDIRRPPIPLEKTEHVQLDLTVPGVDRVLAELLARERVDTVVHAAFLAFPTHATEWAHELEDIGTMHMLNACAEVTPARFVMVSSTLLYGAHAQNPNFLREEEPVRESGRNRFLDDKVRAEQQLARFAEENPTVAVAVLRFAPILGPTVQNLFTRYFARPTAPALLGCDPLMQFVHESDAIQALALAVERRAAVGPFNIVGDGVLPYRTVLALMGRVPITMPHFIAEPLQRMLWVTQLADTPPGFLDFLRYLCVADGARARRELGFSPRFGIERTVRDFLGVARDDGAPDPIHAQG